MAQSSPVAWHPHRTSFLVGAAVVGALISPFAALETFALGLSVLLTAVFAGRGRLDGAAGAFFVIGGGLLAAALPFLVLALLEYG
jgi:hypothetical protein